MAHWTDGPKYETGCFPCVFCEKTHPTYREWEVCGGYWMKRQVRLL